MTEGPREDFNIVIEVWDAQNSFIGPKIWQGTPDQMYHAVGYTILLSAVVFLRQTHEIFLAYFWKCDSLYIVMYSPACLTYT